MPRNRVLCDDSQKYLLSIKKKSCTRTSIFCDNFFSSCLIATVFDSSYPPRRIVPTVYCDFLHIVDRNLLVLQQLQPPRCRPFSTRTSSVLVIADLPNPSRRRGPDHLLEHLLRGIAGDSDHNKIEKCCALRVLEAECDLRNEKSMLELSFFKLVMKLSIQNFTASSIILSIIGLL